MADASVTVMERTTQKLTSTIKDENLTGIPNTSLTTLTLTLYDVRTAAIIAGRNKQNVLNANGVTVDGSGNLVWVMDPADNPILDDTLAQEVHCALFEFTYAAGAKRGQGEVNIVVRNSAKVQ